MNQVLPLADKDVVERAQLNLPEGAHLGSVSGLQIDMASGTSLISIKVYICSVVKFSNIVIQSCNKSCALCMHMLSCGVHTTIIQKPYLFSFIPQSYEKHKL